MKTTLAKYTTLLFILAACDGPRGTEVGNGAKPQRRPAAGSRSPDGVNSSPIVQEDLAKLILSSHCHSLLMPSRTGLPTFKPYTAPSSLDVVMATMASEKRVIAVEVALPAPKIMLGGDEISRQSPDSTATTCVGQEAISTSQSPDGSSLVVLESRLKISDREFAVRIERVEKGDTSILGRVELRGPEGYRVVWQVK